MPRKRLSICYAAPGSNLVPSAGTTRNVLNLADALSEWADVTVAFRRIQESPGTRRYRTVAIDPHRADSHAFTDDNAARGLQPLGHLSYTRTLWSFASRHAAEYDVVLEKGWRLSGFLCAAFNHSHVPGVLVENDVRFWTESVKGVASVAKYGLHLISQWASGLYCRRLPNVIAESEELKALLVQRRGLAPDRVDVVGLGVDHSVFRPMDQSQARAMHAIRQDATVLLYVGAMDEYHDLEPLIEGLALVANAGLELHVLGEGEFRSRCEAKAKAAGLHATFHGHVPHAQVPEYIATADLCLAPYRTSAFYNGLVTFSTLKIPEYMACARPVISVPSGSILRLVDEGRTGFVRPNEVTSWASFLRELPPRDRLASMGEEAARAVTSISWTATAQRYLEICERRVASAPVSRTLRHAS